MLATACVNSPPPTRHPESDSIRFVARSGIARANGIFHRWRIVEAEVAPGDPADSFLVVEIDVASIDTGLPRRDAHLLEPDWFDAERWPKARARVSHVKPEPGNEGRYRARIELQIRDRTGVVEGRFRRLSERPLVVEGELRIDRTSFGVGAPDASWNPMSPRNEVELHYRVTLQEGRLPATEPPSDRASR